MVVRLGVVPVFVADVLGLLPQAVVLETTEQDGDEVIVELTVTNQASFRSRLYSLGLRARVLEPPELAGEIIGNLHAVIRSGS